MQLVPVRWAHSSKTSRLNIDVRVRGTTKWPRAEDRRVERVGIEEAGIYTVCLEVLWREPVRQFLTRKQV